MGLRPREGDENPLTERVNLSATHQGPPWGGHSWLSGMGLRPRELDENPLTERANLPLTHSGPRWGSHSWLRPGFSPAGAVRRLTWAKAHQAPFPATGPGFSMVRACSDKPLLVPQSGPQRHSPLANGAARRLTWAKAHQGHIPATGPGFPWRLPDSPAYPIERP